MEKALAYEHFCFITAQLAEKDWFHSLTFSHYTEEKQQADYISLQ
jgi:hypothetical protein